MQEFSLKQPIDEKYGPPVDIGDDGDKMWTPTAEIEYNEGQIEMPDEGEITFKYKKREVTMREVPDDKRKEYTCFLSLEAITNIKGGKINSASEEEGESKEKQERESGDSEKAERESDEIDKGLDEAEEKSKKKS